MQPLGYFRPSAARRSRSCAQEVITPKLMLCLRDREQVVLILVVVIDDQVAGEFVTCSKPLFFYT